MTLAEEPLSDRFLLLGQAIDRLREALARELPGVIVEVAARMEGVAAKQIVESDRRMLQAAGTTLRMESRPRQKLACDSIEARAHRRIEALRHTIDGARTPAFPEDEDAKRQTLAAELGRAVRESCGSEYGGYAMRVASLMQGLWHEDELNPIGARTIAASVLEGFRGLGDSGVLWSALRDALLECLPGAIRTAIREVRCWLESTAASGARDDDKYTGGAPATIGNVDTVVRAAQTACVSGLSSFEAARPEPVLRLVPALRSIMEIEGDALEFARSLGTQPYGRQARAAFFDRVRERLASGAATPGQFAVVDVVAAMFDYVIDDRRLSEQARPLIWRLQLPSVALALMDPHYLGDHPGSLRGLIENVGAICTAHTDELSPGGSLHRRVETIVRAVEVVATALQARVTAIGKQVEQEYARAADGVARLAERAAGERVSIEGETDPRNRRDYRSRPGPEREQAVTEQLAGLLQERLERNAAPDSVREFLSKVWMRRLRTAALRDGEDSAGFRLALQVVDDLLWSLDTDRVGHSRGEFAQRIPKLIRVLTQGARETGANDDDFKSFFDELFLMHLRRMQGRPRGEL